MRALVLSVPLCLCAPVPLLAQCPDGTPPPCGARDPRGAARTPTLDANRIAILPFRVTTADTMLGEGVAELLAAEFTGESGPRAVHMGSVLRAWRAVGGGAGRPLPPADAQRAARAMGAGLVVDGSVVGIGSRLRISASVMTVANGRVRQAAPVTGPADSLDVLMRRFSAGVLGLTGGEPRAEGREPTTGSPEAMRAYIEGLAAFRRGRFDVAATAFERALDLDPVFAQAAYQRYRVAAWRVEGNTRWPRLAFALRDRLAPHDRAVLIAFLGEQYPAARSPAQVVTDRERAVAAMPDSPDALYLLGDYLYHYGAAVSAADREARAADLFERSLAADTQATVLQHLVEIALVRGDTALLRRLRSPVEALISDRPALSWGMAVRVGDPQWLASVRLPAAARAEAFGFSAFFFTAPAADALYDAMSLPERASVPSGFSGALPAAVVVALSSAHAGRPAAAARALGDLRAGASAFMRDPLAIGLTLFENGDYEHGAAAARRLASQAAPADSTAAAFAACALGLWEIPRGNRGPDDALLRAMPAWQSCAMMLDLLRAEQDNASDLPLRLAAADSAVRRRLAPNRYIGFENVVLARLWERAGNVPRALDAIRLRPHGILLVWTEASGAREEGRLAALAGDTVGAVRAYRRYLDLRRDPEPVLIPQRDSVRAELARLERR